MQYSVLNTHLIPHGDMKKLIELMVEFENGNFSSKMYLTLSLKGGVPVHPRVYHIYRTKTTITCRPDGRPVQPSTT